MKNIHVLPTSQPSRLIYNDANQLCYQSNKSYKNDRKWMHRKKFNIYITSDELIKEGDFYLHISNDINGIEYTTINNCHKPHRKQDNEWYVDGMYSNQCKKIILTTDDQLIADGIQPIDDEFLEWFVKNPSCEYVEIIYNNCVNCISLQGQELSPDCCHNHQYKIIIPKEEPKQLNPKDFGLPQLGTKEFNNLAMEMFGGKPKQETLEEAAEMHLNSGKIPNDYKSFIQGAKWQQNNCVQFINKLEDESFDGWSKEAKSGYLTACMTIKQKYIDTLNGN
jgi:hypothetical protein